MPNRSQLINDYTELSNNNPKHTRPTDKQMGLGTHDFMNSKSKDKNPKG